MAVQAQQPPQRSRAAALDRRAHERHEEDGRLLPAVLGRAQRIDVPGDPALRHRLSVLERACRPGSGSNDIGLDRGRGGAGPRRALPARRPARAAGAGQPVVPIEQQQPARAQVGRGLVREIGPLGIRRRRRIGRSRARRCHRFLPARHQRRRQLAAARQLSRRSHAQRVLSAEHQELSRRTPKST